MGFRFFYPSDKKECNCKSKKNKQKKEKSNSNKYANETIPKQYMQSTSKRSRLAAFNI